MIATELATPFTLSPCRTETAERALIERLRRGDAAAIGEAYDQHHATVRREALSREGIR